MINILRNMHLVLSLATTIACGSGCGDSSTPLAPVHGTILLNDKLLTTGRLMTVTDAGHGAGAFINSDGSFELKTYESGQGTDGAVPGTHHVAVSEYDSADTVSDASHGKSPIPKRYANAATSELTIEVEADGENSPVLKLTAP